MSLVFVDTSAWAALADPTDSGHRRARAIYGSFGRKTQLVTTNYVLQESYTWIRYKSTHYGALQFHQQIQGALRVGLLDIQWVTPEIHEAGWGLFHHFEDQVLSFTDCTSAVVARERKVDFVFSFDSDFSVLGFDVRPGP